MPGNSVKKKHVQNSMSNNRLMLANNVLFAAMLACPMFQGATKYFANTYLCLGIILLLSFLNFCLHKAFWGLRTSDKGLTAENIGWKLKARLLAWSVLVPTVILVGTGPIINPAAYEVDKFTRVFGVGVINDYSVSKKVHYFYFALIIFGLLAYNFYLNIILSLKNNLTNKIRRLKEFSDTLLFVGWSFCLVCAYRQFSSYYSYDLTLCLLKSFMLFIIPAFYFWETGKFKVQDVRVMSALAIFSLALSVNVAVYFDTRNVSFDNVLAIALSVSTLIFILNKLFGIIADNALYSRIVVLSLIGSASLVFFSLAFELSNIQALKNGRFINVEKILQWVFYTACWLSLGWVFCSRTIVSRKVAGRVLLVFVVGVSLIIAQPSLIIGSDLDIYESANYTNPVSDFFNFGKVPLFENFPGHGLSRVISSLAYGAVTSDYTGALFAPWNSWLYTAACVVVLYCFVKDISNSLIALSTVIFMPYLLRLSTFYALGLAAFLPFAAYVRTFNKKYLVMTAVTAVFLVAYKLDVGFTSFAAIVCSSLCVSFFYMNRIIYSVILYLAIGLAAVFALFMADCLIKDINPLFRIQQYLSVVSSNEHWGRATLGDAEKNSYPFFYFVLPVLSVACFLVAAACRKKFTAVQLAVLLCLLFAYYSNLPRILVRHSLAEYKAFIISIWLWTIPFALAFLVSRLLSSRPLYALCQTSFLLMVCIFFQTTTLSDSSPLQNAVSRAEHLSAEVSPDTRKKGVDAVFSRGSRVTYDASKSIHLLHAGEIRSVADLLLSPGETYLDFANLSAAYAWSGRENPAYVVQPPSMLSGEKSQMLFISELEKRLKTVPIAIMPANKDWYLMMHIDGISNNIRHYLVAEWIYNNYRPLFKYNEFASVWVLNTRYDEFLNRLPKATELVSLPDAAQKPYCHDCSARMTDDGLLIQPTGPDPFILGFERMLSQERTKPFSSLTLNLADDNNGSYQLFFTSDKVMKYEEKHSLRPNSVSSRIKFFDFGKFQETYGQIKTLRLDVPESANTVIKSVSVSSLPLQISPVDWGYDNFISMPVGESPSEKYISNAHDYNVGFLPYIWGRLDSRKAAENIDLAKVSESGDLYTWNSFGHEGKPAYLRVDLSEKQEFLKKNTSSYLVLGNSENGAFTPLIRFKFSLREGKNVYLFRISSDYYWSRGKLNAVSLDRKLKGSALSVRLLNGD